MTVIPNHSKALELLQRLARRRRQDVAGLIVMAIRHGVSIYKGGCEGAI